MIVFLWSCVTDSEIPLSAQPRVEVSTYHPESANTSLTTASGVSFLLASPALTQSSSQRWWFGFGLYSEDKRLSVKIWFSAARTASSLFAHLTTQTWPWVPAGTQGLLAWSSSPWMKETSASGEEPSDPRPHPPLHSPSLPTRWHFLRAVVGPGDTLEAFRSFHIQICLCSAAEHRP